MYFNNKVSRLQSLAQQQKQGIFAATIARFMAHVLNTFYCRGALILE